MTQTPFLNRFRQEASSDSLGEESQEELFYCLDRKLNVTSDNTIFWSARTRRRGTTCHTASRWLKSGYTRSGKWRAGRRTKAKRDRRQGR